MNHIDKAILSLAYTPGVGTICMDIFKDPQLVNKYTFRGRSAAILTDGTLLNSSPKNFMPVMDWFVFQIKKFSGIDAYPFVVMKEANVSEIIQNLANSYSIIIYLDNQENIKVPSDVLFIRHRAIVELSNSQLTDAKNTANVMSYFKSKEFLG